MCHVAPDGAGLVHMPPQFSVDRINRAGAVVVRRKLDWINKQHLHRRLLTADGRASLARAATDELAKALPLTADEPLRWSRSGLARAADDAYVLRVLDAVKVRVGGRSSRLYGRPAHTHLGAAGRRREPHARDLRTGFMWCTTSSTTIASSSPSQTTTPPKPTKPIAPSQASLCVRRTHTTCQRGRGPGHLH